MHSVSALSSRACLHRFWVLLLLRYGEYGEEQRHKEKVAVLEDAVEKLEQKRAVICNMQMAQIRQSKFPHL